MKKIIVFLMIITVIGSLESCRTTKDTESDIPVHTAPGYCERYTQAGLQHIDPTDPDALVITELIGITLKEMGNLSYRDVTGEEGFQYFTEELKKSFVDDNYPARVKESFIASKLEKKVCDITIDHVVFYEDGTVYGEATYTTELISCNSSDKEILDAGFSKVGDTKTEKGKFVVVKVGEEWKITLIGAIQSYEDQSTQVM